MCVAGENGRVLVIGSMSQCTAAVRRWLLSVFRTWFCLCGSTGCSRLSDSSASLCKQSRLNGCGVLIIDNTAMDMNVQGFLAQPYAFTVPVHACKIYRNGVGGKTVTRGHFFEEC